ncbi:MAG: Gfo/Idh/MocA family oxidoreductase [Armatimonadota bacterium]|nr:Gfo/Idh/MocA family oxidoreductase [Armatimonadota bacterium]
MPVRVGFVGAGGIANAHMNVLQLIEDVQITCVCDVDKDRAQSAAARFVAKAYADYREMLHSEKIDALYVCVPPYAHEEQELLAARKGIHLFVEKPVALTLEKARQISEAISQSGIVAAVGYHWRYQSNTDRAREILSDRQIGMVLGYWMGGFPGVSWWRRMEQSGGQMVEQTTHIFDLARYLCGEIVEVYAAYANRDSKHIPDFNVYDVGAATIKFANGAIGSMSNTCLLSVPYTVGLHVIARDLIVEIHGDLKVIQPGYTQIFTGGVNAMQEENRAFIKAVKTGDRSDIRSTYEDAVKTLAVTLACNESAAAGKPIKVPEL